MADGYFKLHRKWLDCSDLRDHTARGWWATILTKVGWGPRQFRGHRIQPGELGFSYRAFAAEEGVSTNTLRHWLSYFESRRMITLTTVGTGPSCITVLRIVNWQKYPNGVSNSETVAGESVSTTETLGVAEFDTQGANSVSVSVSPTVSVTGPPVDTQRKKNKKTKKQEKSSSAGANSGDQTTEPLLELEREFVSLFNSTEGVTKNRGHELTPKRRRTFRARCNEQGWIEDLRKAMAKFPLQCFQGQTDPWRPDVEWILKPDSVTRIIEGRYDWTKTNGLHRNSQQDPSRIRTGEYE